MTRSASAAASGDPHLPGLLEVATLRRGEVVVHHDPVRIVCADLIEDLPDLAAPHEGRGDGALATLSDSISHHLPPSSLDETARFGEITLLFAHMIGEEDSAQDKALARSLRGLRPPRHGVGTLA